jgi:hypothetical protein
MGQPETTKATSLKTSLNHYTTRLCQNCLTKFPRNERSVGVKEQKKRTRRCANFVTIENLPYMHLSDYLRTVFRGRTLTDRWRCKPLA